jgi:hypothetical protein
LSAISLSSEACEASGGVVGENSQLPPVTTALELFLSASEVDVHKPFFQYLTAGILIRFGYIQMELRHIRR